MRRQEEGKKIAPERDAPWISARLIFGECSSPDAVHRKTLPDATLISL